MAKIQKKDYQSLSAELESIVQDLQSGELDLEKATEKYKKGLVLVNQLEKLLNLAENNVKQVTKKNK